MTSETTPRSLARSLVVAIEASGGIGPLSDPKARNRLKKHRILKSFRERANNRNNNSRTAVSEENKIKDMYDLLLEKAKSFIKDGIYKGPQVKPAVLMLQTASDIFHVVLYVTEKGSSDIVTSRKHRTGVFVPRQYTKNTAMHMPHLHLLYDGKTKMFEMDATRQRRSIKGASITWKQRIKVPGGYTPPAQPEIPGLLTPEENNRPDSGPDEEPTQAPRPTPPAATPRQRSSSTSSPTFDMDMLSITLGIGGAISAILAGVRVLSA
jgi:hypothetical protein